MEKKEEDDNQPFGENSCKVFALGPDKLEYLLFIETYSWACYRSSALTPMVGRHPEVDSTQLATLAAASPCW